MSFESRAAFATLLSLLAAWLVPACPAAAQEGPVKGNLGITISALPARLTPGDSVRLLGSTGLTGSSSQVSIVVRPPGKPPVTLQVKPGTQGAYQIRFGATGGLGTYQVEAVAPDGKGKASTSFTIVSAVALAEETARKADSLVMLGSRVVDRVQQAVDGLPASPAKNEVKEKLDKVDSELAKLPQQVAALRQQMSKVFAARTKVAKPIPEWVDYEEELVQWEADADQALAKLEKLAAPTAAATQGCSDLDRYNEMLTFTSEAMNYLAAPFDLSRGFWTDKIPGGLVARSSGAQALTSAERFALVETMKIGAAALQGPAGIVSAVPGLLLDTAQWFVQDYFGKFCEKWEGPMQGTFLGESFTRQGEPFFDYTIMLDGKLMLLYPKNVPAGKPVSLQGYFEGNGRFEIRDNPKPIARLVPGSVLFHRITAPPGSGYWDELGQASRGLLPHSFRIPVKGIMAGDSIMLTLQPADHDFGPTVAGVSTWVIMPLGGLVPEVINAKIGLQKAHPIIERVIRRRPVLRFVTAGKSMTAEATFSRDTTNTEKTARVRTTLKVKACNPGCLPLPGGGKL
ncbi:MAG TPA: hypothetical protein VGA78_01475 [Gemmatimonadales bacterium]